MHHPSPWIMVLISTPLAFAGTDIPQPITSAMLQANNLASSGHLQDAASLLEANRALAAADRNEYCEALILNNLGLVYERQQKYLPAQNAFDGSIALVTKAKGPDDPAILEPLNNEAQLLYEAGQYAHAESLLLRNLAVRNTLGVADASTATQMGILGKVYLSEKKYSEAKQTAEDSLKILEKDHQTDGLSAALAYSVLGAVYTQWGQLDGARQSLERSLSLLKKSLPANDYRIGEGMANLGLLYANEGVTEKAEPLLEKANVFFRASRLNSLFTREFLSRWAQMERKWGHKRKAKALSKEAEAQDAISPQAAFSPYVVDVNNYR